MHLMRVRIKLCGMKRLEDINAAVSLGIDAIGVIFYHKSPRCVTIKEAKRLLENIPAFVNVVAVVVNPEVVYLKEIITELPIQYIQFHGDETPLFCEQFSLPYIKAISATGSQVIINAMNEHKHAAAFLLDTPSMVGRGGMGVPFDWKVIPDALKKPFILAGGLNAENVKNAITSCSPYAVDVCTGIEASFGVKDHAKMKRLVEQVRGNS